jgi:hypothetical protein
MLWMDNFCAGWIGLIDVRLGEGVALRSASSEFSLWPRACLAQKFSLRLHGYSAKKII